MPIESIVDREDILAAVRNYHSTQPVSLVGTWGVFLNNQLVEIRGFWNFRTRGRALTKRRQFIDDNIRTRSVYVEELDCRRIETINVFGQEISLRIPILFDHYRVSISEIDLDLMSELLNIFEVRQITHEDALHHCAMLSRHIEAV